MTTVRRTDEAGAQQVLIDRPGTVETRGIEPVPDNERHGKASGMFWTFFAANIGVLGITEGAALTTFDRLNAWQSLLVAVIGALGSFAIVGGLSIAGRRGGAPGLTLSRAVFGTHGNVGPTIMSWLSFVGWETIMCTTAAYALLALLQKAGLSPSTPLTVICILVIVAIAATVGLFGHATIMWVQKWLTYIFGTLTLVVIGFLMNKLDWHVITSQPAGPTTAVIGAIGFIAAGTGIGWLSAGADYARYLPKKTRGGRIAGATAFGAGIPLIVLITLGALLGASNGKLAGANDPVGAIGAALPTGMAVPYLITAVIGLIAAADLSMYSSGLNLITAGINIRRTWAVAIDAVLIIVGGLYITVISKDFYGSFTTFLTLLAVPLSAWAAVFGLDMIVRRHYDTAALMDRTRHGKYWYVAGVRWQAVLAWASGIVIGLMFTTAASNNDVWFSGPWADSWLGRNALGWLIAGLVAAVIYAVVGMRSAAKAAPAAAAEPELAR